MRRNPTYWVIFICVLIGIVGCVPQTTATPSHAPSQTAILSLISSVVLPPHRWPIPPLTVDQVNEVKGCYIKLLASQRYPKGRDWHTPMPQSSCDWAVLAYAYVRDNPDDLSPQAKSAFSQAVSQNVGFALVPTLFYAYFNQVSIIEPPTFGQNQIKSLQIKYEWGGLSDPVYYTADINDANTTPVIAVRPKDVSKSLPTKISKSLIQALIPALTDLIPVRNKFPVIPCVDNYPRWQVFLILTDNTKITATTSSNFISFGGPWFVDIDGQEYFQISAAFPKAVGYLISSLGLPPDQPSTMTCGPDNENIFGLASPQTTMAIYGTTPLPPPSPAVTPTSILRLTHLPPSEMISGTFGFKHTTYAPMYNLVRFFDDGTVTYEQIMSSWIQDIKEWPALAYSSTERDTARCQGDYYLKARQIEFSLACSPDDYRRRIDMTGTYDVKLLILDSYHYLSGYTTKQIFLPIDDISLKP